MSLPIYCGNRTGNHRPPPPLLPPVVQENTQPLARRSSPYLNLCRFLWLCDAKRSTSSVYLKATADAAEGHVFAQREMLSSQWLLLRDSRVAAPLWERFYLV